LGSCDLFRSLANECAMARREASSAASRRTRSGTRSKWMAIRKPVSDRGRPITATSSTPATAGSGRRSAAVTSERTRRGAADAESNMLAPKVAPWHRGSASTSAAAVPNDATRNEEVQRGGGPVHSRAGIRTTGDSCQETSASASGNSPAATTATVISSVVLPGARISTPPSGECCGRRCSGAGCRSPPTWHVPHCDACPIR
jgi:hypothetical protein